MTISCATLFCSLVCLVLGCGSLSAADSAAHPYPTTIEEAVRMTGGTVGVVASPQSAGGFVNQSITNGLAGVDGGGDKTAGGSIERGVETPNALPRAYVVQAYRFTGTANEAIRVVVKADGFAPELTLFNNKGGILAVDFDSDGDRKIVLPLKLPYTGQFAAEVIGKEGQLGKYTILIESVPPVPAK